MSMRNVLKDIILPEKTVKYTISILILIHNPLKTTVSQCVLEFPATLQLVRNIKSHSLMGKWKRKAQLKTNMSCATSCVN